MQYLSQSQAVARFHPPEIDGQLSQSLSVFHRYDAVDDQIHRDSPQLHAVSDDQWKISCQFRSDRDVESSPRHAGGRQYLI